MHPLAKHRKVTISRFRYPYETWTNTERLRFEITENCTTVPGDLLIVVPSMTDRKALRQELIGREVKMELRSSLVIGIVGFGIEHNRPGNYIRMTH